ncbi:hypothetical protein O181_024701 [Austropuccinia psidii MF-1]|uniref:Retroviral polymerase SH3-like domain-containing protein n=1 Tax=Austropuccinia psidii MF-1 TaxID=1389203 RepID=A0A9Q3CLY4_9BASI|nr:hypothetical protein [Austropuccinia psidii MF-1]
MEPPGQPGILIGYDNNDTTYRIVHLKDSKVSVMHHATFNEQVFPKLSTTNEGTLTFFHKDIKASCSPNTETYAGTVDTSNLTTAIQATDAGPQADLILDTTEQPPAPPL